MEVKTNIKKIIKSYQTIFITGHKNLDLDAIGGCIGILTLCRKLNKKVYIIVDDEVNELGVQKILNELNKEFIIKTSDIENLKSKKDLLVVVDTNKKMLLQSEELNNMFNEILVIDHHETNEKSIITNLKLIDNSVSSTCEIIAELIKEYKVKLTKEEATIILAGIVLDTYNFVLKTNSNTFRNAYYLTTLGADPKKVQYYLKQDLNDYILRQNFINNIKVINNIAITYGNENIKYKREDLAKMADTLLQFNGIEASFVVGKLKNNLTGISARSEGNVDVSLIAEKLNGGGNKTDAAAQIEDEDIETVFKKIVNLINGDE